MRSRISPSLGRPPYGDAVDDLDAFGPIVARDGVLVLERASRLKAPDAIGRLARSRDLVSGDSALSFYAWPP